VRATETTSPRRVLVVTNETVASEVLHDALAARAAEAGTEGLVVAPALNTRLRHWLSDEDDARLAASRRLEHCLLQLAHQGIPATGHVGDGDPLLAISDALQRFGADEVVIATHANDGCNWLARDLVPRTLARFGLPVVHVVADSSNGFVADARGRRLEPAAALLAA
jgi:GABA permease